MTDIDLSRLISPTDLSEPLTRLYREGMPRGSSTGWPALDRHYTIAPGYLSICTGWPNSGKSEFLDALMLNLTGQGWEFLVYSPENQPYELHLAKLAEKLVGCPFAAGPTRRMEAHMMAGAVNALETCIRWIPNASPDGDALNIAQILEIANEWLAHKPTPYLVRTGLILDPWNEIAYDRPAHVSETEYVGMALGAIRRWARDTQTHVWIIAHPQKMRRDDSGKLPVPRPDMISGSQHWWNKADNCVTVWRDMHDSAPSRKVEVHIQKVRFKHHGSIGMIELDYDKVTGSYTDPTTKVVTMKGRKAKSQPLLVQGEGTVDV